MRAAPTRGRAGPTGPEGIPAERAATQRRAFEARPDAAREDPLRAAATHSLADVALLPPAHERPAPQAADAAPVQRLVAVGNRVFAPRAIRHKGKLEANPSVSQGTYMTSLRVLVPGAQTLEGGDEFGALVNAVKDSAAEGAYQKLWAQYQDVNRAYVYANATGYEFKNALPTGEQALMDPKDMGDKTAEVPRQYVESAACVLQSLASLGIAMPGSDAEGTAQEWHRYAVQQKLDYRTDSDYLKLYVTTLGMTLVSSRLVAWANVPWDELGDGDYLVTTYGAAPQETTIGHMVGVRVADGEPTVFDHQDLTAPILDEGEGFARYIFKT